MSKVVNGTGRQEQLKHCHLALRSSARRPALPSVLQLRDSAGLQHFVGTPKVGFLQAHQQHGSQQRFTVSCSRQAPTQPNPQGFEHPGTQLRAQLCLTATGALAWIACVGP